MNKRMCASMLLIGIALLAYSQTDNAIPDSLKSFSSHLEFLGYSVTSASDKSVSLKHEKFPNEKLLVYNGGVLVSSWWSLSEEGKNSGAEISQLLNNLNKKSVVTKYYLDDDGDLDLEAWYPGEYDKARFALFMTKIQQDWNDDVANFPKELQKYLQ